MNNYMTALVIFCIILVIVLIFNGIYESPALIGGELGVQDSDVFPDPKPKPVVEPPTLPHSGEPLKVKFADLSEPVHTQVDGFAVPEDAEFNTCYLPQPEAPVHELNQISRQASWMAINANRYNDSQQLDRTNHAPFVEQYPNTTMPSDYNNIQVPDLLDELGGMNYVENIEEEY